MRKSTIILAISIVILGLSSCNAWLDVRPENEIVLEDYWQTEAQASSVLAACYKGLANADCISRMIVWGEARSDNMVAGYSLIGGDLYNVLYQNITPTNYAADWGSFYSVINYCNTYLNFAPDVVNRDQNFTLAKLHAGQAEALTIRALCYFYLVRAFKEVPLVLEPSISDQQDYNVAKSTEREVIDQIIGDLKTALMYAKTDYGKGAYNKGRITLNAVNALLADVYLWDQQYSNCVTACNTVINDNSLKLERGTDVLTKVFYTGNSTESIFELQFDNDNLYNSTINSFYGVSSSNYFGLISFPKFLAMAGTEKSPFNLSVSSTKESVSDLRAKMSFGTSTASPIYPIYKYVLQSAIINSDESVTPVYRNSSKTANWIIYRLSDVELMKAEALVQLNRNSQDLQDALKMVNTTYLRSNTTADSLSITSYADKSSMEKLVLRERQRELLFEGKRWFDLVRYARRLNDAGPIIQYITPKMTGSSGGIAISKMTVLNALYMPVAKSQLEVNPKLTQNPFYIDDATSN